MPGILASAGDTVTLTGVTVPAAGAKPKVYWRPVWYEDQDPADACWAVKVDNMSVGFSSWQEAYRYAYLYRAMESM